MRKMWINIFGTAAMAFMLCLTGLIISGTAFADCGEYTIVCQDETCHGPYGMCWSWKKFMCVPCHDNNASVCNSHGGPKCVWCSSSFTDIVLVFLCKYVHLPDSYCVVCNPPPSCVKSDE